MQMRSKDENDWKNLYPKTLADNVTLNNGNSVQTQIEEIEGRFPEDVVLWEGSALLNAEDSVKPNKPLSECANGWILVWRLSGSNQQYQYQVIPKISLNFVGGGGTRAVLGIAGGVMVHKYFYPRDTEITGHSSNENGDNAEMVLYRVLEF